MSKERFLAKFGSENHIDSLMDEDYIYDLIKNPLLQPRHIDKFLDKNVWEENKAKIISHPNASIENLDKALNQSKNENGIIPFKSRRSVNSILSHPNIQSHHFDDIIHNAHELIVGDAVYFARNHPNPGEFLDKVSKIASDPNYPGEIVKKSIARNKHTPTETLKRLSNDPHQEVKTHAMLQLAHRGIEV